MVRIASDRYARKMKSPFAILQTAACIIFLGGFITLLSGLSLPVYTSPNAPEKLSEALSNLPVEQQYKKWHTELPKIETAHKRLTDIGRGVIALALGISVAAFFLRRLRKINERKIKWFVAGFWTLLWAVKIPLTIWYYWLRQERFDYPVNGDAIAIPIVQDWVISTLGFIVFSILLWVLLIRRNLPQQIGLRIPRKPWEWIRSIILWLWIALLLVCIFPEVIDGDEGMVLSCTGAIPVILLALSTIPKPQKKEPDAAVEIQS